MSAHVILTIISYTVTVKMSLQVEMQKNTRGELLALLSKRRSQELGFDCIQRQGHGSDCF